MSASSSLPNLTVEEVEFSKSTIWLLVTSENEASFIVWGIVELFVKSLNGLPSAMDNVGKARPYCAHKLSSCFW